MNYNPKNIPTYTFVFIGIICFSSIITAFIAQYGFNIMPCKICSYQRVGFCLLGTISIFISIYETNKYSKYFFLLVLFSMIFLSIYHIGLEKKWWTDIGVCKNTISTYNSIDELRSMLWNKKMPRCNEITWKIFDISSVIWTLIIQIFILFLFLFQRKFKNKH